MKLRYIFLLLALSFIILAVYNGNTGDKYKETKEMIILRKMVHELLLSSGDSTSRILPVKQVSEYEYHLIPEKPLAINPDSFVSIVNKTVNEGKLPVSFTASVVKSQNKEMVFGFAASPSAGESDVACIGRNLPKDAYYISFVFSPQLKIQWSNYFYFFGAVLALTGLLFWIKRKKAESNSNIPAPVIIPVGENNMKEGCIQIGKYLFDPVQQQLELAGEKTPLTIKETKVLQILANAPNTIVERETLQKEVWENEGVIVTRSLDMFISKLRKKLTEDAAIKIVNVHGIGYRLDING
ncbi:MAG: winged helix-turn-helix domain-containing protein [Bacteroidota bacterium]